MSVFKRSKFKPPPPGQVETVIGPTTNFKGAVQNDGGLRVEGVFEGSVETGGNLIVSEEAKVIAEIVAYNVSVAGSIKGNVTANRVEVLSACRLCFGRMDVGLERLGGEPAELHLLERSPAAFQPFDPAGQLLQLLGDGPELLDRSVVEVYANGRAALTAGGNWLGEGALAPEGGCTLTLLAGGDRALASAVDVWEMTSIWGVRTA